MANVIRLSVILPHGLEEVGSVELEELGAESIKIRKGCITCNVPLPCFYRLHLRARLPFRFLREINHFKCYNKESLFRGIQNSFDLEKWLHPSKSFRVNVSGSTGELNHSHFTALEVKNALIDLQREIWAKRSDVNLNSPDICFHLYLKSDNAILSVDSFSSSLHKRGYRSAIGLAPLKENIAAGLIKISNWNDSLTLVDPFCGAASFLIEAANIAKALKFFLVVILSINLCVRS